jgi:hypothetical protein
MCGMCVCVCVYVRDACVKPNNSKVANALLNVSNSLNYTVSIYFFGYQFKHQIIDSILKLHRIANKSIFFLFFIFSFYNKTFFKSNLSFCKILTFIVPAKCL